ncbi:putative gamma-glutamylcyclotransferase CG2811 isoform X2 [Cherax quadricarinatus]|uniref:putative gamma-glutamylcyclotransferase CG2811 isoform X2 n=1 Tax=Cherax quadricarinatus TaxID=27406 RepID=UPI00387E974A
MTSSVRPIQIMIRHLVFVYGTLKRNEPNHHWLTNKENGEARLISKGTTQEKYPLVIGSRFNIPYVLAAPDIGENIEGEVYEVDNKMLSMLDMLEDHPEYYERKIKKICLKDSDEVIDCWIYLLFMYKQQMMELPFLKTYSSYGDHGKNYAVRESRGDVGREYWSDVKVMD